MSRRPSPWVKICGLTTPEAVATAVECEVDAIGFVFHASSPRNVTPARAAALARAVPAHVARVAVTLHPSQALVDEICAAFGPDVLQTDAADLDTLRIPAGVRTLPVYRAGASLPAVLPPRVLYEGPRSGAGALADWETARDLARRTQVVLAGGLEPKIVGAAIAYVLPFGVDVSSGVESAAGVKDPQRIREFVAAARVPVIVTGE